ncbi:unnamed protein product [Absidia cylindrospora]
MGEDQAFFDSGSIFGDNGKCDDTREMVLRLTRQHDTTVFLRPLDLEVIPFNLPYCAQQWMKHA